MRRREFLGALGALGGAATWPLAARAQQDRVRRIGLLSDFTEPQMQPLIEAFLARLRQLGWNENAIRLHNRFAIGDPAQFQVASAAIVAAAPDVIVTLSSPALRAIRQETRAIPVVFTFVADPVAQGLVESLARPGGNLTGFTHFEFAFAGKWLEALKEIKPGISEILLIVNPNNPGTVGLSRFVEQLGPAHRVDLLLKPVQSASDIEREITEFHYAPNRGIIIVPDGLPVIHRDLIIGLTNRARIPTVFPFRTFPVNGGLMSWGTDVVEIYRQAADYVDQILRGKKPSDLPVQAPTKFELVINLKTAKALGLSIPPTLLTLANEIIE